MSQGAPMSATHRRWCMTLRPPSSRMTSGTSHSCLRDEQRARAGGSTPCPIGRRAGGQRWSVFPAWWPKPGSQMIYFDPPVTMATRALVSRGPHPQARREVEELARHGPGPHRRVRGAVVVATCRMSSRRAPPSVVIAKMIGSPTTTSRPSADGRTVSLEIQDPEDFAGSGANQDLDRLLRPPAARAPLMI